MVKPSLYALRLDTSIIQERNYVLCNFLAADVRELLLVIVRWEAVETILVRNNIFIICKLDLLIDQISDLSGINLYLVIITLPMG